MELDITCWYGNLRTTNTVADFLEAFKLPLTVAHRAYVLVLSGWFQCSSTVISAAEKRQCFLVISARRIFRLSERSAALNRFEPRQISLHSCYSLAADICPIAGRYPQSLLDEPRLEKL